MEIALFDCVVTRTLFIVIVVPQVDEYMRMSLVLFIFYYYSSNSTIVCSNMNVHLFMRSDEFHMFHNKCQNH